MNYPTLNQDMILEIFSYCPASAVEKFRFLNKDYYRQMSEFSFINLNLHRTKSIFGVFLQYQRYPSTFNSSAVLVGDGEVSLDFLPIQKVKILACDPSHGIFLCTDSACFGATSYIVCKPTTRQYRTIPNPETGYSTVQFKFRITFVYGLIVIQTNPFRYKIVKLSMPYEKCVEDKCYNLMCEVFDSGSFAWKRLDDVKLPKGDLLQMSSIPASNNRFMHWLTISNKNVFRFCMKTETWSLLPLPKDLASSCPLILANHEGKLGVIVWKPKGGRELKGTWVLDSDFDNSWVNVKKEKSIVEEEKLVLEHLSFLGRNDVVVMAGFDWVGLYDMKTNRMKSELFKITLPNSSFSYASCSVAYFPFYSDFERLGDLVGDDVERS